MVRRDQLVDRLDSLDDTPRPLLVPELLPRDLTQLLLISVAVAERVVRQLEMEGEPTVGVHGRAETRTQGEDDLDAFAGHHVAALEIGVIGNPHRHS